MSFNKSMIASFNALINDKKNLIRLMNQEWRNKTKSNINDREIDNESTKRLYSHVQT